MAGERKIKLMEVCGTHTMAIARAGIRGLLPPAVELISGPGCPVCVTSQSDIDRAVAIARRKNVIMTTFGDMMMVPGSKGSFAEAKMEGAAIRVLYSCLDALSLAQGNPDKKIVFMGVGFETTSPTVAATIVRARQKGIANFFVLSCFKLIAPALDFLARSPNVRIDGFICPGHVSVITGSAPYERIARRHEIPCVITGFDEIDIIKGIKFLVGQIKRNSHQVEIEYERVVRKEGNRRARRILNSVFAVKDARWRGLGVIEKSGLKLRKEFEEFSAEKEFKINVSPVPEPEGCICGEILQGIKYPLDCSLFKKACTPQSPIGPCMVSSEGTCAAYYRYGGIEKK